LEKAEHNLNNRLYLDEEFRHQSGTAPSDQPSSDEINIDSMKSQVRELEKARQVAKGSAKQLIDEALEETLAGLDELLAQAFDANLN
jgi:hypothetical protein